MKIIILLAHNTYWMSKFNLLQGWKFR